MPAHTHLRRMETYLYYHVPEGQKILYVMGEPQETRPIWLNYEQAVISPEWSIPVSYTHLIISLGASVMMPIIFTVIGLCIGMKVGKALKSGLCVGCLLYTSIFFVLSPICAIFAFKL